VGSNGLIQTAASGAARFDHNPATGESLGLLVEEARTNLTLYSGDFSQAHWSKISLSIFTANNIIAPNGTLTGSFIAFENATSPLTSAKGLQPNTSMSAGTNTISCFAKIGTARYLALGLTNNGGETSTAVFDLQTGTVSGANSHPSFTVNGTSMVGAGAGWYRCSLTSTYAAGMAGHISSSTSGLSGVYGRDVSGNGTSGIYVWGAQLEAGSLPTSYIPTTTATVTRAADVASMTGGNFSSWYNQSQGTIFTSVRTVTPASASNGFFQLTDGTVNNRIEIQQQGSGDAFPRVAGIYRYLNSTTGSFLNQETGWNTDGVTVDKWAFGFNSLGFTLQTKFDSTPSTGSGTFPQNLTNFSIGHCGTIARLAYYPVRLPDTTLQALTAT
jgi:hypothetical protein